MRERNYMMKQISTVCRESPRNRGVLRRCQSPMATPGRSGLHESPCASRSILPKWKWIFLTSLPNMLPEKRVWDSPVGRNLDKSGQNWPNLARIGHGWPKLDKAGQNWTAGGQLFQPFCGARNTLRSVKQKTRALFLAGLHGSGNRCPLRSGKETTKKRPGKSRFVHNLWMPTDRGAAAGGQPCRRLLCGRDFEGAFRPRSGESITANPWYPDSV